MTAHHMCRCKPRMDVSLAGTASKTIRLHEAVCCQVCAASAAAAGQPMLAGQARNSWDMICSRNQQAVSKLLQQLFVCTGTAAASLPAAFLPAQHVQRCSCQAGI